MSATLDGIFELERLMSIAEDALDLLASHVWPGNVRELENVIIRLIVGANKSGITRADVEMASI